MANHLIGVVCGGNSQAPNEPCGQSYFPPDLDATNTLYYQNQQPDQLLLNHEGNINASQAFNGQMNTELPSLQGWEEQNFLPDSSPNDALRILDGTEQENFAYNPWFDINGNATNLQGPTW